MTVLQNISTNSAPPLDVASPNQPQISMVNIVNLLMDAVIFLSTSLFIYVFKCRRSFLFRKPSNKLMFSLTLVDCFTSIVAVTHILQEILPQFYIENCNICISFAITIDVCTTYLSMVSILHLCALTADRYTSIFRALRYNAIISTGVVRKTLTIIWVIPIVTSGIQVIYLYPYITGQPVTENKGREIFQFEMIYSMISFILFTLFPMIALTTAYVSMFIEVRSLLLKTRQIMIGDDNVFRKQLKMGVAFCMMYICFLVFSVPYFTLRLLIDWLSWLSIPVTIPHVAFSVTYTLKNVSSLCNSYIYLIMNKEFRQSVFKVLHKKRAMPESSFAVNSVTQVSKSYNPSSSTTKQINLSIPGIKPGLSTHV